MDRSTAPVPSTYSHYNPGQTQSHSIPQSQSLSSHYQSQPQSRFTHYQPPPHPPVPGQLVQTRATAQGQPAPQPPHSLYREYPQGQGQTAYGNLHPATSRSLPPSQTYSASGQQKNAPQTWSQPHYGAPGMLPVTASPTNAQPQSNTSQLRQVQARFQAEQAQFSGLRNPFTQSQNQGQSHNFTSSQSYQTQQRTGSGSQLCTPTHTQHPLPQRPMPQHQAQQQIQGQHQHHTASQAQSQQLLSTIVQSLQQQHVPPQARTHHSSQTTNTQHPPQQQQQPSPLGPCSVQQSVVFQLPGSTGSNGSQYQHTQTLFDITTQHRSDSVDGARGAHPSNTATTTSSQLPTLSTAKYVHPPSQTPSSTAFPPPTTTTTTAPRHNTPRAQTEYALQPLKCTLETLFADVQKRFQQAYLATSESVLNEMEGLRKAWAKDRDSLLCAQRILIRDGGKLALELKGIKLEKEGWETSWTNEKANWETERQRLNLDVRNLRRENETLRVKRAVEERIEDVLNGPNSGGRKVEMEGNQVWEFPEGVVMAMRAQIVKEEVAEFAQQTEQSILAKQKAEERAMSLELRVRELQRQLPVLPASEQVMNDERENLITKQESGSETEDSERRSPTLLTSPVVSTSKPQASGEHVVAGLPRESQDAIDLPQSYLRPSFPLTPSSPEYSSLPSVTPALHPTEVSSNEQNHDVIDLTVTDSPAPGGLSLSPIVPLVMSPPVNATLRQRSDLEVDLDVERRPSKRRKTDAIVDRDTNADAIMSESGVVASVPAEDISRVDEGTSAALSLVDSQTGGDPTCADSTATDPVIIDNNKASFTDGCLRFGVEHLPLIFDTYRDGVRSCRLCLLHLQDTESPSTANDPLLITEYPPDCETSDLIYHVEALHATAASAIAEMSPEALEGLRTELTRNSSDSNSYSSEPDAVNAQIKLSPSIDTTEGTHQSGVVEMSTTVSLDKEVKHTDVT